MIFFYMFAVENYLSNLDKNFKTTECKTKKVKEYGKV